MSTFVCDCGSNVPLAKNHDDKMIGVWCGNCNQKYTYVFNASEGQAKLWKKPIKCNCQNTRTSFKGYCSCIREGEE